MELQDRTRRGRIALRGRVSWLPLLAAALVAAGCGTGTGYEVTDGTYLSLVPSLEQFGDDVDSALPGGLIRLRQDAVDSIEVEIRGVEVIIRLDGIDTASSNITDRLEITDSEGSGPFKAKRQILVLGEGPLDLGGLVINDPVIWPGSFEESPVITLKPFNPDERGPVVSCAADEQCLLLSSGVDPAGAYADANNPDLNENPIDSILIDGQSIDFTLDTGRQVSTSASAGSFTRACGLSKNRVWDLPAELGLAIDDPVLIHTLCPSTPGAGIQLVIMNRPAIPLLAPLTEAQEGNWCEPGPECLLFVPT